MLSTHGTRCVERNEISLALVIDRLCSPKPAIDAFQTILSAEFNRLPGTAVKETPAVVDVPVVQPLVYGTYQAYLRRNPEHLKHSLAHARAHGYALGVKLVRGAYHEQESARWRTMGCDGPTPVWATKPETDACYDGALELALDLVKDDIERNAAVSTFAVLFGTHNKDSVALVASGLQKRGLAIPTSEGSLLVGNEARKRVAVAQLYGASWPKALSRGLSLMSHSSGDSGMCDALTNATAQAYVPGGSPIVLKYVPWGQLDDVMPYLGRRAIENKTVLKGEGGATSECARAWNELKRRWFGFA
jgi:proline dehydrogenase